MFIFSFIEEYGHLVKLTSLSLDFQMEKCVLVGHRLSSLTVIFTKKIVNVKIPTTLEF